MSMCSPMGRSMCMTWTLLDSRWLSPRAYRPAPAPAVPSHALAMARCMSALAEMVAPVATGACSLMIWSAIPWFGHSIIRSEEHTSELQSRLHLVCRLLLEKKKKTQVLAEKPKNNNRPQMESLDNLFDTDKRKDFFVAIQQVKHIVHLTCAYICHLYLYTSEH